MAVRCNFTLSPRSPPTTTAFAACTVLVWWVVVGMLLPEVSGFLQPGPSFPLDSNPQRVCNSIVSCSRTTTTSLPTTTTLTATTTSNELPVETLDRVARKSALLELLSQATGSTVNKEAQQKQPQAYVDSVLADPVTKQALTVELESSFSSSSSSSSLIHGGWRSPRNILDDPKQNPNSISIRYKLYAATTPSSRVTYTGSSDSYINLLAPAAEDAAAAASTTKKSQQQESFVRNILLPLIPPPVRSALATAGLPVGADYVPMRDLFTSPAVSFAYERGWRQGFGAAGFPGPDPEAAMALEYFAGSYRPKSRRNANETTTTEAIDNSSKEDDELDDVVLVDMSCATGLFTRRFATAAASPPHSHISRVLGCDYSASMLDEARRRIDAMPKETTGSAVQLDLIRCDVGQIPMQTGSVDGLHAGAAMHCWPDLPRAASEIYRVLRPDGGRYFATTFLSSYFKTLQQAEGGAAGPSRQAFQYFESVQQLRNLMEEGGFDADKIFIEVLGNACVVIRCEK